MESAHIVQGNFRGKYEADKKERSHFSVTLSLRPELILKSRLQGNGQNLHRESEPRPPVNTQHATVRNIAIGALHSLSTRTVKENRKFVLVGRSLTYKLASEASQPWATPSGGGVRGSTPASRVISYARRGKPFAWFS